MRDANRFADRPAGASDLLSDLLVTRRSLLLGAAGVAAFGLVGCTGSDDGEGAAPTASPNAPAPLDCPALLRGDDPAPLWEQGMRNGLVYGSSTATWQIADRAYRRLFAREAAILFTEDDLLWYRLRPTPRSELDFTYGDEIVRFAEAHGMLAFGAHLVWDEGFGEGWTDDELWGMDPQRAAEVLFGTVEETVARYRGRMAGWVVANEVLDGDGLRTDVPWYATLGATYVEEAFRIARNADPEAVLVLNDFGFEIDDDFAGAADKRAAALELIDDLQAADVPVHALGVQAHLDAGRFAEAFDPDAYRTFLADVAGRGLSILVTELDVLDNGVPRDIEERDRAVADTIARYLDVALDERAVASLMTFGLSDRYTWLQEDFPRRDGVPRRPLPFDEDLRPKPAQDALMDALAAAPPRPPLWVPARC